MSNWKTARQKVRLASSYPRRSHFGWHMNPEICQNQNNRQTHQRKINSYSVMKTGRYYMTSVDGPRSLLKIIDSCDTIEQETTNKWPTSQINQIYILPFQCYNQYDDDYRCFIFNEINCVNAQQSDRKQCCKWLSCLISRIRGFCYAI